MLRPRLAKLSSADRLTVAGCKLIRGGMVFIGIYGYMCEDDILHLLGMTFSYCTWVCLQRQPGVNVGEPVWQKTLIV